LHHRIEELLRHCVKRSWILCKHVTVECHPQCGKIESFPDTFNTHCIKASGASKIRNSRRHTAKRKEEVRKANDMRKDKASYLIPAPVITMMRFT
jgi:hypothetical protein